MIASRRLGLGLEYQLEGPARIQSPSQWPPLRRLTVTHRAWPVPGPCLGSLGRHRSGRQSPSESRFRQRPGSDRDSLSRGLRLSDRGPGPSPASQCRLVTEAQAGTGRASLRLGRPPAGSRGGGLVSRVSGSLGRHAQAAGHGAPNGDVLAPAV